VKSTANTFTIEEDSPKPDQQFLCCAECIRTNGSIAYQETSQLIFDVTLGTASMGLKDQVMGKNSNKPIKHIPANTRYLSVRRDWGDLSIHTGTYGEIDNWVLVNRLRKNQLT
jgi:hypothetical protein